MAVGLVNREREEREKEKHVYQPVPLFLPQMPA
jgi:hypothetical protein